MKHGTNPRILAGIMVVLAGYRCGEGEGPAPTEPEGDLGIAIVSGDGQRGPVGTSLTDFLVVRASVGEAEPAQGVLVEWSVLEGGGQVSLKGHRTDREGLAAALLFLGDQPGEQVVRAGLESGAAVLFTAQALSSHPPATPGRRPHSDLREDGPQLSGVSAPRGWGVAYPRTSSSRDTRAP